MDKIKRLENEIEGYKKIEKSDATHSAKLVTLGLRTRAEEILKEERKKNWINPNY